MEKKKKKQFKVEKNGKRVSPKKARVIDYAVKRATKDYKWAFKKLGST